MSKWEERLCDKNDNRKLLIESSEFVSKIKLSKGLKESLSMQAGKAGTLIVKNIPVTILDRENLNGRIYSTETMRQAIEEAREAMADKQTLGQANEHPESSFVAPTDASHVIINAYIKENIAIVVDGKKERHNVLFTDWEVLNTTHGKDLRALFEAECSFGTSIRGVGELSGKMVENYSFISVDGVGNPSSSTYTRMPVSESVKVELKDPNELKENYTVMSSSTNVVRDLSQAGILQQQLNANPYGTITKTSTKVDQETDPKTGAQTSITTVEADTEDEVSDLNQAFAMAHKAMTNGISKVNSVTIEANEDEDEQGNKTESVDSDNGLEAYVPESAPIEEDQITAQGQPEGIEFLKTLDEKGRYMFLGRMQADCKYFLNGGNYYNKFLWANNPEKQIEYMKWLYNSFPDNKKPEWISMEEIEDYERQMVGKGKEDHSRDEDYAAESVNFDKQSVEEELKKLYAMDKFTLSDEERESLESRIQQLEGELTYENLVQNESTITESKKEEQPKDPNEGRQYVLKIKDNDPEIKEDADNAPEFVAMKGNAIRFTKDPKKALHFTQGMEESGIVHYSNIQKLLADMGYGEQNLEKWYKRDNGEVTPKKEGLAGAVLGGAAGYALGGIKGGLIGGATGSLAQDAWDKYGDKKDKSVKEDIENGVKAGAAGAVAGGALGGPLGALSGAASGYSLGSNIGDDLQKESTGLTEDGNTKYSAIIEIVNKGGLPETKSLPVSSTDQQAALKEIANQWKQQEASNDVTSVNKLTLVDNQTQEKFNYDPKTNQLVPENGGQVQQQAQPVEEPKFIDPENVELGVKEESTNGEIEQNDKTLDMDIDDNTHVQKEFDTPVQASVAKAGIESGKLSGDILLSDAVKPGWYVAHDKIGVSGPYETREDCMEGLEDYKDQVSVYEVTENDLNEVLFKNPSKPSDDYVEKPLEEEHFFYDEISPVEGDKGGYSFKGKNYNISAYRLDDSSWEMRISNKNGNPVTEWHKVECSNDEELFDTVSKAFDILDNNISNGYAAESFDEEVVEDDETIDLTKPWNITLYNPHDNNVYFNFQEQDDGNVKVTYSFKASADDYETDSEIMSYENAKNLMGKLNNWHSDPNFEGFESVNESSLVPVRFSNIKWDEKDVAYRMFEDIEKDMQISHIEPDVNNANVLVEYFENYMNDLNNSVVTFNVDPNSIKESSNYIQEIIHMYNNSANREYPKIETADVNLK